MRISIRPAVHSIMAAVVGMAVLCSTAVSAGEGMVRSELTNEWIDASIASQRPVAVMVDNESIALPHYGVAEGDIVYELMNSLENNRISRLMVVLKDWGKITQMGSIRSTRTSNIPLAAEWNAVLVHDGGPFYVNDYFSKAYAAQHFSGDFSRVNNGKAVEFTEYVLAGDLDAKFNATGFPRNYNEFRNEDVTHFEFAPEEDPVILSQRYGEAFGAQEISLPFYHNGSILRYNETTGTYDYYEYGALHTDAEDGQPLTFKNVLVQECSYTTLDSNGYMNYMVVDAGRVGYYMTGGEAIPITWVKNSETDLTRYYDNEGNEITINTGKTYIALVPDDSWSDFTIH